MGGVVVIRGGAVQAHPDDILVWDWDDWEAEDLDGKKDMLMGIIDECIEANMKTQLIDSMTELAEDLIARLL